MNPVFVDLLRAFIAADVRFLVVGAYAGRAWTAPRHRRHGRLGGRDAGKRCAGDSGAGRIRRAALWRDRVGFRSRCVTYQMGVPPGRIDLLTELTAVSFAEAWPGRVSHPVGDLTVDFIGRAAFIRNKRATGRTRDLADIEGLE